MTAAREMSRNIVLILALLLVCCQHANAAGLIWTKLTDSTSAASPPARGAATMAFASDLQKLILFGGGGATGTRNDCWIYDLTTMTWSEVPLDPSMPAPVPRSHLASGVLPPSPGSPATHFVVAHGTKGGAAVVGDTWALSLTSLTWEEVTLAEGSARPAARYAPAYDVYPGSQTLIMSHGFGATHRYSDAFAFSLAERTWTKFQAETNPYAPFRPHARCLAPGAMVSPNTLLMFGGCLQNGFTGGPCPSLDTWRLQWKMSATTNPPIEGASWERLSNGPTPRSMATLSRVPSAWGLGSGWGLLLGGDEVSKQTISVGHGSVTEIWLIDSENGRWSVTGALPNTTGGPLPGFRIGGATAVDDMGGRLFTFGGVDRDARGEGAGDELWMLSLDPEATSLVASLSPAEQNSRSPNVMQASLLRDPPKQDTWFTYMHLHGLFMGLAWGFLLPMGAVMARYVKGVNSAWFIAHKAIQVSGLVLATIGLIMVFVGGASNPAFAHGIIGLIVMVLGYAQPLNGFLRPHLGAPRRALWELCHKNSGRLAVLLGLLNVSLGTFLVAGPSGLWIAWHAILGIFVLLFFAAEFWLYRRRGRDAEQGGKQYDSGTDMDRKEEAWGPHGGKAAGGRAKNVALSPASG